jgi:hypothetical protein
MTRSKKTIEEGLATFRQLTEELPAVRAEFARTRGWFGAPIESAPAAARGGDEESAARRHLEWFLLERPSEELGGVPAEVLSDPWRAQRGGTEDPGVFLNSLAGAFEVTGVDRSQGLWLRDIFGVGEYPVEEEEAAADLEEGDLLVGRLYPVGEEIFRLSPAMGCFRDAALLDALRGDIESLRTARRGVLRVEQVELEGLFFGGPGRGAPTPEGSSHRAEQDLRGALAESGLEEGRIDRIVRRANDGSLTEILNELAFDTEADIEQVRGALAGFCKGASIPSADREPAEEAPAAEDDGPEAIPSAAEAIAAFDAGRGEGKDLEGLFKKLEGALGCGDTSAEESAEEEGPIDFPGAVGAMVEEYLWEVAEEGSEVEPIGRRTLPLLARYGTRIGVFENLSAHDLLDFAGRWVLREGRLAGAEEARDLIEGLRGFTRWCDAEQSLEIAAEFTPLLEELAADLPRLAEVAPLLGEERGDSFLLYEVATVGEGSVELRDEEDILHRVKLERRILDQLCTGDLLRAHLGELEAAVSACYPAALRRLRK